MNEVKNCLIYNYAQHYRLGIFKALDKTNDFHFYFGDKYRDVKKLDYSLLPGFVKEFRNFKIFKEIYLQYNSLETIFKQYKNYIILGEYFCLSTWAILFYLRFKKNKKVYLWSHGYYGNESKIKYFIKDFFFNLSDGVFLYGNHAKNIMLERNFKETNLHVIYNSLDYTNSIKLRDNISETNTFKSYFNNNNQTLLFIGRLTKVKKLHMLLNVLNRLKKESSIMNLFIIGDGDLMSDLKVLSKKLQINSNVFFYGDCYDEEIIAKLIYNSDLVVSPGNVGLTAIHSMSYGTPVITHSNLKNQMPEVESIISGVTGDFFEENNENSLFFAIKNWFKDRNYDRNKIRNSCFKQIDSKFNPQYQKEIICNVLK